MNREENRLATFSLVGKQKLNQELALLGFYKLTRGVKCHFCFLVIDSIDYDDDILSLHCQRSPRCKLMTNNAPDNIPIDVNVFENKLYKTGDNPCKYPLYKSIQARLDSYKDWPISMNQRPREMAKAGFFYTGRGDRVTCFECGTKLRDWELDSVPSDVHQQFSPLCDFARRKTDKDEIMECKICFNSEIDSIFVPCNHVFACMTCAIKVDYCPKCTNKAKSQKIFIN